MDTTVAASPDSEASEQTTDTSTFNPAPDPSEVHPLDAVPEESAYDEPATPTGRLTRGLGSTRHTTSVVIALLAVPAGYGFADYGSYYASGQAASMTTATRIGDHALIGMAAAAGCFFLAMLAGRISAMGPLLAALVWGAAPSAWVILDYPSFIQRLNDLPAVWDHIGFGLAPVAFAVFPIVTGLLLGGAIAGRWRRAKPVARW
jgi:hypothetical protein